MLLGFVALHAMHLERCRAAAAQRIVVVEQGDTLTRAIGTALSSWGVDIQHVEERDSAEVGEQAAAFAGEHGADALVWLTASPSGLDLHVFTVQLGHAVVRALYERIPLDAEAAAAAALSVKTELRNTPLAPPVERREPIADEGVSEASADAGTPVPATSSGQNTAESVSPAREVRVPFAAAAHAPRPWLRVEAGAGLRSGLASASHLLARFDGALTLFEPWWSGRRLGIAIETAGNTRAGLRATSVRGSLREVLVGAALRGLVEIARGVELDLAARASAQHTRIVGHRAQTDEAFDTTRLNWALGGAIGLQFRLPKGLFVAPRVCLDRLLRTQRYFVGREVVAELTPYVLSATLRLGVGLN